MMESKIEIILVNQTCWPPQQVEALLPWFLSGRSMLQRISKDAKLQSVKVPKQVPDGEEHLFQLHTKQLLDIVLHQ